MRQVQEQRLCETGKGTEAVWERERGGGVGEVEFGWVGLGRLSLLCGVGEVMRLAMGGVGLGWVEQAGLNVWCGWGEKRGVRRMGLGGCGLGE